MIIIRDVKCKLNNGKASKQVLFKKCAKLLKIKPEDIKELDIYRRSIDARKKPELFYNYQVLVNVRNEEKVIVKARCNKASIYNPVKYTMPSADLINSRINIHPYIIGAGPAGLFCGLILARAGLKPIIIERGSKVDKRRQDVENFWKTNKLNPDSNVQFGEGGAGTFSDGKLNTVVKDKMGRNRFVLETFVNCGARPDILIDAKPHIGTDILIDVVANLREEIINLGGQFYFDTKLEHISYENNKISSITLSGAHSGTYPCEYLCLAIGHSARDTFAMLYDSKINMTAKQFAVGLRIQHLQEDINSTQYGENYRDYSNNLPASPYKVTANLENGRGVFSFCMCPGGYVVNASSEEGLLAVNGMSNADRDSMNANSAIIVTVGENEYALDDPMGAIEYQRSLERKAYELGGGNIPIQLYGDYKNNIVSTTFGKVKPIGDCKTSFGNLREIFSDEINDSLIEGIEAFGNRINGFNDDDALLAGVESRTSSPVRITRDERLVSNIDNIFPCGEGAGYAGGIMSAAMDGMKVAEAMINKMCEE